MHFLLTANSHRSHALGELEHSEIREPKSDGENVFPELKEEEVEGERNIALLLLPPRILGYATREKLWGQFSINDTKSPPGPQREGFDKNLQLAKEYKDLIRALVESHNEQRAKQVQDVVHDKGRGLVLLLHGKI